MSVKSEMLEALRIREDLLADAYLSISMDWSSYSPEERRAAHVAHAVHRLTAHKLYEEIRTHIVADVQGV